MFNQHLIFMNLYRYAKNQVISFCFGDVVDLKILQFDRLRVIVWLSPKIQKTLFLAHFPIFDVKKLFQKIWHCHAQGMNWGLYVDKSDSPAIRLRTLNFSLEMAIIYKINIGSLILIKSNSKRHQRNFDIKDIKRKQQQK